MNGIPTLPEEEANETKLKVAVGTGGSLLGCSLGLRVGKLVEEGPLLALVGVVVGGLVAVSSLTSIGTPAVLLKYEKENMRGPVYMIKISHNKAFNLMVEKTCPSGLQFKELKKGFWEVRLPANKREENLYCFKFEGYFRQAACARVVFYTPHNELNATKAHIRKLQAKCAKKIRLKKALEQLDEIDGHILNTYSATATTRLVSYTRMKFDMLAFWYGFPQRFAYKDMPQIAQCLAAWEKWLDNYVPYER